MRFLYDIAMTVDPAIASVCSWTSTKCLRVAGSELRVVSNRPAFLQGLEADGTTFVILGAGSSDPAFMDMLWAVDTFRNHAGTYFIEVW